MSFDSATPATISSSVAITGLVSGDEIRGIDFRPANGVLYAMGLNTASSPDVGRIYTINVSTGVASQIGTNFSTSLTETPNPPGPFCGFDFSPVADRIRVVNNFDQNLRVNPDTGALTATDPNLDVPSANEEIVALAHDRSDRNPATATTLFGIEFDNMNLVRIGGVDGSPSPDGGVATIVGAMGTIASVRNVGFDIAEDGVGFVSMIDAGSAKYRLYTINLTSGALTLIGNIGLGTTAIRGIAAVPSPVANITSGKFFPTIQAAVDDAQTFNNHIIVVNAGTFNELVTVNKSLTFFGAKMFLSFTGTDPGRGVYESIVRGSGTTSRTSAFHILASNVDIEGFTIQDTNDPNNFGAGIFMGPNLSGTRIRNNIFQNNIVGLEVSNNLESNPLIIENNLFSNNNQPGPNSGTAIYTDHVVAGTTFTGAAINNNTFTGNENSAVLLGSTQSGSQKNIAITNNTFQNCGNALLIFNTFYSFITGNTMTGSIASQLVLGGGSAAGSAYRRIVVGIAAVANNPARNTTNYTAIVRGVNGTTGIAVVEVFALP